MASEGLPGPGEDDELGPRDAEHGSEPNGLSGIDHPSASPEPPVDTTQLAEQQAKLADEAREKIATATSAEAAAAEVPPTDEEQRRPRASGAHVRAPRASGAHVAERRSWKDKVKAFWQKAGDEAQRIEAERFDQAVEYRGTPGGDQDTRNTGNAMQLMDSLKKDESKNQEQLRPTPSTEPWLDKRRAEVENLPETIRQLPTELAKKAALERVAAEADEELAAREAIREEMRVDGLTAIADAADAKRAAAREEAMAKPLVPPGTESKELFAGMTEAFNKRHNISPAQAERTAREARQALEARDVRAAAIRAEFLARPATPTAEQSKAEALSTAPNPEKLGELVSRVQAQDETFGIPPAGQFNKHHVERLAAAATSAAELEALYGAVKSRDQELAKDAQLFNSRFPKGAGQELDAIIRRRGVQLLDEERGHTRLAQAQELTKAEKLKQKYAEAEDYDLEQQDNWERGQIKLQRGDGSLDNLPAIATSESGDSDIRKQAKKKRARKEKKLPKFEGFAPKLNLEQKANVPAGTSERAGGQAAEEVTAAESPAPKMSQEKEVQGELKVVSGSYMETKVSATESQDAIIDAPAAGLGAVLDGMGGRANGREAAYTAAAVIQNRLVGELAPADALAVMKAAAAEADEMIRTKAKDRNIEPGGTTLAAVKILKGGRQAGIVWAGDSRVYRLRDGKLEMLTLDDSVSYSSDPAETPMDIQKKMSSIGSAEELNEYSKSNKRAKAVFNKRNQVSGSLGYEYPQRNYMNTILVGVEQGDRFIITSDGVHDNLTTDEIQQLVAGEETPAGAAHALVKASKAYYLKGKFRAKEDDVSAVVMSLEPGPEATSSPTFKIGQKVTVSRSQGGMESDWEVQDTDGYDSAGNQIFTVAKLNEHGEIMLKRYTLDELAALQPKEEEPKPAKEPGKKARGRKKNQLSEIYDKPLAQAKRQVAQEKRLEEFGRIKSPSLEPARDENRSARAAQLNEPKAERLAGPRRAEAPLAPIGTGNGIIEALPAPAAPEARSQAAQELFDDIQRISAEEAVGNTDIGALLDRAVEDGFIKYTYSEGEVPESAGTPEADEILEGIKALYERQTAEYAAYANELVETIKNSRTISETAAKEEAINQAVEGAIEAGLAQPDANGIFGLTDPDDETEASREFMDGLRKLSQASEDDESGENEPEAEPGERPLSIEEARARLRGDTGGEKR